MERTRARRRRGVATRAAVVALSEPCRDYARFVHGPARSGLSGSRSRASRATDVPLSARRTRRSHKREGRHQARRRLVSRLAPAGVRGRGPRPGILSRANERVKSCLTVFFSKQRIRVAGKHCSGRCLDAACGRSPACASRWRVAASALARAGRQRRRVVYRLGTG